MNLLRDGIKFSDLLTSLLPDSGGTSNALTGIGVELLINYTKDLGQKFVTLARIDLSGGKSNSSHSSNRSTNSSSSSSGASVVPNAPAVDGDKAASDDSEAENNSTATTTTTTASSTSATHAIMDMPLFARSPMNEETEELLLNLLLGEAQGSIRNNRIPMHDLILSGTDIRPYLDAKQRFRLGVGLAKLGLFDLSLKHVWLAASPWEAPIYRLRAKLVFSPVHDSVRSLAAAVDNFEKQAEMILLNKITKSPMMVPVCNSLNEVALALQSLPLLHLAGFAAPRFTTAIGHSPAALPLLLGEVFEIVCPSEKVVPRTLQEAWTKSSYSNTHTVKRESRGEDSTEATPLQPESALPDTKTDRDRDRDTGIEVSGTGTAKETSATQRAYTIGIVSGSFDGIPGKVVIGLLEGMTRRGRARFDLIAMCFPNTPRHPSVHRMLSGA